MTNYSSTPLSCLQSKKSRRNTIYEGRTKILCDGTSWTTLILFHKDIACVGPDLSVKNQTIDIPGKGSVINRFSSHLHERMSELSIPTHYIKSLNMSEQLIRACEPFAFEVVMHNVTTTEISKRLGLDEDILLPGGLCEYVIKNTDGHPVVVSQEHLKVLGHIDEDDLDDVSEIAKRVNDFMCGAASAAGYRLMKMRLKFGRTQMDEFDPGEVVLIDGLSPEKMVLHNMKTDEIHCGEFSNLKGDIEISEIRDYYANLMKNFNIL